MNFLSTFHFWPWASLTAHLVQGKPSSHVRSTLFFIGMIFCVCLILRVGLDWIVLAVKIMNNGERDGVSPFLFHSFISGPRFDCMLLSAAVCAFRFQNHPKFKIVSSLFHGYVFMDWKASTAEIFLMCQLCQYHLFNVNCLLANFATCWRHLPIALGCSFGSISW